MMKVTSWNRLTIMNVKKLAYSNTKQFLIYLFLLPSMLFSQSLKVIDCITKSKIPFYTIISSENSSFIGVADREGEFLFESKYYQKEVWIHSLGYEPQKLIISDEVNNVVCLSPKMYLIDEVVVFATSEEKTDHYKWKPLKQLSYIQRANDETSVQRGNLYSFQQQVVLSAVSVFITKESEKGSVFRVRIYQVFDEESNNLDSVVEMGKEQILAYVSCKGCWQKYP